MTPAEFEWTEEKCRERITSIDNMFEKATGWGSWMASASSERRQLCRVLRSMGFQIEDKWVMTASGRAISD